MLQNMTCRQLICRMCSAPIHSTRVLVLAVRCILKFIIVVLFLFNKYMPINNNMFSDVVVDDVHFLFI